MRSRGWHSRSDAATAALTQGCQIMRPGPAMEAASLPAPTLEHGALL
jgi:hypothetical protein